MLDHHELALYSGLMRLLGMFWFLLWRMVAWMILCGVVLGVLIAVLIDTPAYAGGGARQVVGAMGSGILVGGFFGMLPGVLCEIGLAVLTLFFRRRPERTSFYRIMAVATRAVVLLVPAGLLALLVDDSEGEVGIFLPTNFEVFGIPLIISVRLPRWGRRGCPRRSRTGRTRYHDALRRAPV